MKRVQPSKEMKNQKKMHHIRGLKPEMSKTAKQSQSLNQSN